MLKKISIGAASSERAWTHAPGGGRLLFESGRWSVGLLPVLPEEPRDPHHDKVGLTPALAGIQQ